MALKYDTISRKIFPVTAFVRHTVIQKHPLWYLNTLTDSDGSMVAIKEARLH